MPKFPNNYGDSQTGEELTSANVVPIVYESFAAACVAKDACRHLHIAGQLSDWRASMWKFELLRLPGLRADAATEAAEADWVIVAFENHFDLPIEVRRWLDLWQAKERWKPQWLLAAACMPVPLFPEGKYDVVRELRDFARRARCKFRQFPD